MDLGKDRVIINMSTPSLFVTLLYFGGFNEDAPCYGELCKNSQASRNAYNRGGRLFRRLIVLQAVERNP